MPSMLTLMPGALSLAQLSRAYRQAHPLQLAADTLTVVARGRRTVEDIVASEKTAYGINTGFGRLAQTSIASSQLAELQRNLVLSHAAGTGPLLADCVVRLVMLLKLNSLARGYSGVRPGVVETLLAMLNAGIYPLLPSQGSVGASGDLAPLAHMTLALLGEGQVRCEGQILAAREALHKAGITPLVLEAKEGLAMLNGTQVSTALALAGLFETLTNFKAALLAGAMSVDAVLGSVVPFDERIHALRGQPGQRRVAGVYRELLAHSEINRSHADCDKVQDPYSLRCQPQVMGACLDQIEYVAQRLLIEANAVSDNPLIFPEQGEALSGGNFHAEPVALAADNLALAIAEIGSLSERRTAVLMDAGISQLPPFLVRDAGIHSGFMIAQVTAAALVSENKTLAHPASVDSIPTSANQEDHVSMATHAARRLLSMSDNLRGVLAIEFLAAAQGIDLRRPLRSTPALEAAHSRIRQVAGAWERDRYFAPDIEAMKGLVGEGIFDDLVPWTLELP